MDQVTMANGDSSNFGEFLSKVSDAFRASKHRPLRELSVQIDGTTVTITGEVLSFYQKQLAQEIVRAIGRGVTIVNLVDVHPN